MQYQNTIIGKILTPINRRKFKHFVDKYKGDFAAKKMRCWEQFVAILLGQLGNCSSLREIESTVQFHANEHYHLGLRGNIARSTLANANESRDWRIYRDLCFDLISNLQNYEKVQTQNIVKIIDSSPIRLDLINHPWAEKTQRIEGIKLHLIYDLTNTIPTYFEFTGARTNDVEVGKKTIIEKGCTYVFDKGYMNYSWWNDISDKGAYFVTRLKRNSAIIEETDIQIHNEIISSQLIRLKPSHHGKNRSCTKLLRRVFVQREGKSPLVLVTNDLNRSSEEIADLYKSRWQIELFFKWIKQNLKIKKFLGKSENAVKTQICIAIIAFILIRLMQKLQEFCKDVPLKTLITIAKNGLFTKLSLKPPSQKHSKAFVQLHFCLIE